MDYDFTLNKPAYDEGLFKEINEGYYLKLGAADNVQIKAGKLLGIPQRWGLIQGNLALDTDANVADRYIFLLTYSESRRMTVTIASQKFTANQVGSWDIGQALYMNAATIGNGAYTGVPPEGLPIEGDMYHEIWIANAQAGDKWHMAVLYRYLGEGVPWLNSQQRQ